MAAKLSAGLLMYRRGVAGPELFLVHPGGPFFARKDDGAWTIPKGEPQSGEELFACALREFAEEVGMTPETETFLSLGSVQQKGGKRVHCWAFEGSWEAGRALRSNSFELEWPPRSGRMQAFPEVDRAEFFSVERARQKLNPAQCAFVDRLLAALEGD